jgi:large subunit ribosomal protein L23
MNPYDIIKSRRLTEKSRVLENLQHAKSNPSVSRCKSPKAVFNVDQKANKAEIAWAVEQIYSEKKVKVVSVNTIVVKPKKRRVRGFLGKTAGLKKAVVTFRPGDQIEEQV